MTRFLSSSLLNCKHITFPELRNPLIPSWVVPELGYGQGQNILQLVHGLALPLSRNREPAAPHAGSS